MREITERAWNKEGERLFGKDRMRWRFVCPVCGHVASVADWKKVGATEGEVAFSCVGRHVPGAREAFTKGKGPCTYAGGGLIGMNPVRIKRANGKTTDVFEFYKRKRKGR